MHSAVLHPGRAVQSRKIVYIEDNRENRLLVRAVLEAAGYTLSEAEDGRSGIDVVLRERPALILLDINLPGLDGYEVAALLKSQAAFAATPIIGLTAHCTPGDRERVLVAGCDGYIMKPIDVDTFPRQVAEFLGGKRERIGEHEQAVYLRDLNVRFARRIVDQLDVLAHSRRQ
jgi:CheY-like chemotaxis protein